NIKLTAVHLPAVNTPQFDWARTHEAEAPRPVAPVFKAEAAARAIVRAARFPRREYWLGGSTSLVILANTLLPGFLDRYLATNTLDGQHRDGKQVAADRKDNLFAPVTGLHGTRGAFDAEERSNPILVTGGMARIGAVAGVGLLAG